jgi:hypothetical protein
VDPSVLDLPLDGPSPARPTPDEPPPATVTARLAASEAAAQAAADATAAASLERSQKASAKARAVYMGPKPTRATKAVYVDKVRSSAPRRGSLSRAPRLLARGSRLARTSIQVPDASVAACLFGGVYDVLHDSSRVSNCTTAPE